MQSRTKFSKREKLEILYEYVLTKKPSLAFGASKTQNLNSTDKKYFAKLINKLPDYYFVITSPSRSGLNGQTANKLTELCIYNNFKVYGKHFLIQLQFKKEQI